MKKNSLLLVLLLLTLMLCACSSQKTVDNVEKTDTSKNTQEIMNESEAVNLNEYEEIGSSEIIKACRTFNNNKAWIQKYDNTWHVIDTNGVIIYSLPTGWSPETNFMMDLCLVKSENSYWMCDYTLIDSTGQIISSPANDDSILLMTQREESLDIWKKVVVDTYDKHTVKLVVCDEKGNTKAEFYPTEDVINETTMTEMNKISERDALNSDWVLRHCGEGIYTYGTIVFDVDNQNMYELEYKLKSFNDGYGIDSEGILRDRLGNIVLHNLSCGNFGDGLIYSKGGFYDITGNLVIDLSNLKLLKQPIFYGGYAIIEMENEAGVSFVTVIDKSGNFCFEPIEGNTIFEDMKYVKDNIFIMQNKNDDLIMVDIEGNQTELPTYIKRLTHFNEGWAIYSEKVAGDSIIGYYNMEGEILTIKIPKANE